MTQIVQAVTRAQVEQLIGQPFAPIPVQEQAGGADDHGE